MKLASLMSEFSRMVKNTWNVHKPRSLHIETMERRDLFAGLAGRGQDLFVLVNPDDEHSVRVVGQYQQLRHIPDNNILFIRPPQDTGATRFSPPAEEFWADYVATVHNAIEQRGLSNQIDFIAALGQSHSFSQGGENIQSLSYGLMQLHQYFNGMTVPEAQNQGNGLAQLTKPQALHGKDNYENVFGSTIGTHRYYVGGLLAITEQLGNSPDQVIASLRRSAAADGTKPAGTIYFEESNDIRSDIREWQWQQVQADLAAAGIPFMQELDTPGRTPKNRSDVRGAVVGYADAAVPNGSTFLAASWVDNLTSYGGNHSSLSQTKATQFIAAGAAATSGTVEEPYAIASRFPHAEIFTHIDAGLTLGEAYYQAVDDPDMLQFIGDILAQPYADIPLVTMSLDTAGAYLSGDTVINASSSLPANSKLATAIKRLELYVDGRLLQTVQGTSGQYRLNTSALSDGMHELRVVAVANNAAESEGIAVRHVRVSNHGRFVSSPDSTYTGNDRDKLSIPFTLQSQSNSVDRVELRHIGRTVGTSRGAASAIELDLSQLAYGQNQIVPVVVFSDGMTVRGQTMTIDRKPKAIPGKAVPPTSSRTPGMQAEYFIGEGGRSIAASNFAGVADITTRHSSTELAHNRNTTTFATSNIDQLAVRLKASFNVDANQTGEYLWSALQTSDSLRLRVDGQDILGYDDRAYGLYRANASAATFLGEGRHDIEILLANTGVEDGMNLSIVLRGPDGISRTLNDSFVYTFDNSSVTLDSPNITAPTSTVDSVSPLFDWNAVPNATDYEWRLFDGSDKIISSDATTNTQHQYVGQLVEASYRLEVRARAGDVRSDWSTKSFEVQVTPNQPHDEYFTDFESAEISCWSKHLAGSTWNHTGCGAFDDIGEGDNIQLIETPLAHSGSHAVQISYDKLEDRGQALLTIPNGGSEYVRTNQWMRFGENYDFGRQKLHRIYGIDSLENTNFDIIVGSWTNNVDGVSQSDLLSINYNGGFNDWGADWENFSFERERWYEITTEVQLNTPGIANGEVRVWVDGNMLLEKTELLIRNSSDVLIDKILIGGWYSNSGQDPASRNKLLIDDVSYRTSKDSQQQETLASFDVKVVDLNGNLISELRAGESFFVEVYVEDLRDNGAGVFSAYLDVLFPAERASVTGPIAFGSTFQSAKNGSTTIQGVLDEVGAAVGLEPPTGKRQLLLRVPMKANSAGQIVFTADPADELPNHEITLMGEFNPIASNRVYYGSVQLNVLAAHSNWYNPAMPLDVNADGKISPIDALLVINILNNRDQPLEQLFAALGAIYYVDTNNSGDVTPTDALLVINELNTRSLAGESEATMSPLHATLENERELRQSRLRISPINKFSKSC